MTEQNSFPVYEGKAKKLFSASEPGHYRMYFKDSATAFNNKKKGEIERKGILNQAIAAKIFEYLAKHGIESHYVRTLNEREMLVRAVKIIPIEIVIRNIAAGSLCKRLGVEEKLEISPPLIEFFLKSDALDDPLLTEDHISLLKLATPDEITFIRNKTFRINDLLRSYFKKLGIMLVDFKIEFGRDRQGQIILADEITPDSCRLWDSKTMNILDKDRFRKDLGGLAEAYETVLHRMEKQL